MSEYLIVLKSFIVRLLRLLPLKIIPGRSVLHHCIHISDHNIDRAYFASEIPPSRASL